jgi:hypothetical protein
VYFPFGWETKSRIHTKQGIKLDVYYYYYYYYYLCFQTADEKTKCSEPSSFIAYPNL